MTQDLKSQAPLTEPARHPALDYYLVFCALTDLFLKLKNKYLLLSLIDYKERNELL